MKIIVDLLECKTDREVLLKFGEVFQFGGPNGNVPTKEGVNGIGWGINWDAFYDSLCSLDIYGIWGNSLKINFPLEIIITNYSTFKKENAYGFTIMKQILNDTVSFYKSGGKNLKIIFKNQ